MTVVITWWMRRVKSPNSKGLQPPSLRPSCLSREEELESSWTVVARHSRSLGKPKRACVDVVFPHHHTEYNHLKRKNKNLIKRKSIKNCCRIWFLSLVFLSELILFYWDNDDIDDVGDTCTGCIFFTYVSFQCSYSSQQIWTNLASIFPVWLALVSN